MAIGALGPLLEREAELGVLERLLDEAAEGHGSLLLLEGRPGIGKTRLIAAAHERAEQREARGLRAQASELELHFSHGIVRQLFEPPLARVPSEVRAELLAGAAGLAAPLFGLELPSDAPQVDPSFGTLHGLFWLTANLADRNPLVLSVDDLHWCDPPSLRFLAYLRRRLEGLPILLVASLRSAEPGTGSPVLDELLADPLATVLRPGPLTEEGVAALVRDQLDADPEPEFSATVHAETGGNPLLVRELLGAIRAERIEPSASGAVRVMKLAPKSVGRLVLRRLSPLGERAAALVGSVAVLGDEAELGTAAELAGLSRDEAADAAESLRRLDIFRPGERLGFAHPVVRDAVYVSLHLPERERGHARAAELLAEHGAPAARVAAQLLATQPSAHPWRTRWLRAAARQALAQGAPDAAASYLRRALAEPPAGTERFGALLELGIAETRGNPERAIDHLSEALELTDDDHALADAAIALAKALFWVGRPVEAIEALERVEPRVAGDDVARVLEAELIFLGSYYPETYPQARARLRRLRREWCGDDVAGRQLLGLLASDAARSCGSPSEALELARAALAGGVLLREEPGAAFTVPASVLVYLDRFDEALAVYGDALERARRTGSAFLFVMISVLRSALLLRRGQLADAEADARAVEARPEYGTWAPPASLLAEVLIERGDSRAAAEAFDRTGAEELPNAWEQCFSEHRRGRLRILQGRLREGVDDLLAAGERFRALGCVNPAHAAWRSEAALALDRLGEREEALRLAHEELELARAWGAPRTLGKALRSAGLVEGGEGGLALLEEAVAVLSDSPAQLERARALTELGAALRRANRRAPAREPLADGLELAQRCGADALADRARDELVATGARPRRVARSGVDALTPSERRVAQLAAAGQTNREIAQRLFVTAKTVQTHLSHAYQKLDIRSRSQLPAALKPVPAEEAPSDG